MICAALDLILRLFFQLLVQFVQNTSIPLGQELVESEPKDITCLSLLPVTETSECNRLMLPGKIYVADLCDPTLHTAVFTTLASLSLADNTFQGWRNNFSRVTESSHL